MIIDARDLGQNVPQKNKFLPSFDQEKARELVRMLDKAQLTPDDDDIEETLSIIGGANTDRLDISYKGMPGINGIDAKFGWGWDTDYDKDRAIKNCWANSQDSMFGYIGSSGRISDEAVVGMSRDEFSEYMKTHELDKEIDWDAVGELTRGLSSYTGMKQYSDYAAALCASLEQRIRTDFSGEEQQAQLEKLGEVFDRAVNEMISGYRTEGPHCSIGTYGILGVELPEGKLEASVRAMLSDKKDAYSAYIAQNDDYAGIKDTGDKWMERDIGYMANALRSAYSPVSSRSGGDVWNEDELMVIGLMGNKYSGAQYDSIMAVGGHSDEERIGFSLAMDWLEGEKIKRSFDIGEEIRGLCDSLFEKYTDKLAVCKEKWMTRLREDPLNEDPDKYEPYDNDAINAVINKMKESYADSGDEIKAICDAAEFARGEYLRKVGESHAARYKENCSAARYWRDLYNGGMKEIIRTWGSFSDIAGKKDADRIREDIGQYVISSLQMLKKGMMKDMTKFSADKK